MLFRLFFAGFAMMNMMWISIALYSGADRDEFRSFFHWMGLLLATPTLLYSGYPFFAWRGGLRAGHLTMDLPSHWLERYLRVFAVCDTYQQPARRSVLRHRHNLTFVILIGRYLEGCSATRQCPPPNA